MIHSIVQLNQEAQGPNIAVPQCVCMLWVHYPPYLFEVFLFGRVHDEGSKAEIGNGVIVFKMEKEEKVTWGQLQHPESGTCFYCTILGHFDFQGCVIINTGRARLIRSLSSVRFCFELSGNSN